MLCISEWNVGHVLGKLGLYLCIEMYLSASFLSFIK